MEITHKSLTRVDVLTLTGRMDASSAPELEQQIDQLFDQGRYRIVLDLSGLEYIASPGLRVLREVRQQARDWEISDREVGDVRIANMTQRVRETFDLTGFSSFFENYSDTVEAVNSF